MKSSFTRTISATFFASVMASTGQALVIGGTNFADDAGVDALLASSGSYTVSGGSLAGVLTDNDAGSYAFSFDRGAYVSLGFVDNVMFNGSGADLALYELGIPDSVAVTIGGVTRTYTTSDTGYFAGGYALNGIMIDLDDFGVLAGATVSAFDVGMDIQSNEGTVPSLSFAGALNSTSVPEPASVALLGMGLAALLRARRQ